MDNRKIVAVVAVAVVAVVVAVIVAVVVAVVYKLNNLQCLGDMKGILPVKICGSTVSKHSSFGNIWKPHQD